MYCTPHVWLCAVLHARNVLWMRVTIVYMAARITMMLLLGNKLSLGQDHIDGDASRNTCILEVVQFHFFRFLFCFMQA